MKSVDILIAILTFFLDFCSSNNVNNEFVAMFVSETLRLDAIVAILPFLVALFGFPGILFTYFVILMDNCPENFSLLPICARFDLMHMSHPH